jgi:hypothetical protein
MRLWFLSLLGRQEAVKALWARLVKGELATLIFEDVGGARFCTLAPEGPRGWRFFTASLRATAAYHGVLVPEAALSSAERPDFLLVVRHLQEGAGLHYRFLNRRLELPLHPSWAGWLWDRALRTGEAVALESHGFQGYRCIPNSDALVKDLGAAVRRGAVTLPDLAPGPAVADDARDGTAGARRGMGVATRYERAEERGAASKDAPPFGSPGEVGEAGGSPG